MAKKRPASIKEVLFNTLEDLPEDEFKKFKWFLQDPDVLGGLPVIRKSQLEKASRTETVDIITQTYNQKPAEVVKKVLQRIKRNDLVEELLRTGATGTDEDVCHQNPSPASVEPPLGSLTLRVTKGARIPLRSGSPAVYQLKHKKKKFGALTRITVGEKDPAKTNRTILLVGDTGTEKSTLVNALVKYATGVEEDGVWSQLAKEKKKSQSKSQTSDVIVYQIFGFEGKTLPYSLTIIDIPGYGATGGIEKDVIISQSLYDLFSSEDGVHEINAVGLVLKATETRVSGRLRCIFDSGLSVFGKDVKKNTVALITHSDGRTPKNALKALEAANIKCAKDKKNQRVHFLFNFQTEDRTKDTEELQHADTPTTNGLCQFTDFLEKTPPQQLETTMDVLNSRIQLTACIKNLKERAEMIQLKQKKIQQAQEALKKHKQEMKNNENVPEEEDEDNTVKVPIRGGNRWWGCGLFDKEPDGSTSSTRECPASAPVKEKKKTSKVRKAIEEMREKYGRGKGDCESLLENLEKEMEELQKEKDQLLEETFQHVVNLEKIALNVDSLSTHVHLDFLIEKMKEKGDANKVKKLEEMKGRVNKGVLGALRYKHTAAAKVSMKKTIASLKNKDIISKSVLIQSKSPAVYQLRPKTEDIRSLKRVTLGEKDVNQTNRTILLVGETGAGKSTLINALVNYTMGVEWEDDVWFQIVEDEKRNQSESQTSDVIVYQIFGFEGKTLPYSLTIIDTPGYECNRGTEQEDVISQRLFDLFRSEDGVHEMNAVGLVLKATENCLNDRLKYVFDSVVSLFGKNMEQSIVTLITHSDGLTPENALKALKAANMKNAKDGKNNPVYFLFNNCQSTQKTQRNQDHLKSAWDLTTDEMGQFTDFLEKAAPQKLMTTVEVLNTQFRLTACIQNLQERIELTELKQREIQQTHDGLKKHEEEMKNNEKFTLEIDVPCKEKESSKKGATCCKVCKENCHYPCTLALSPKWCDVMKKGCCVVCTKKCPVSDHEKEKKIYVSKTTKVQMDLKYVREKYERSKADCEMTTSLLETLEKEMEEVTAVKYQLLEESFQHIVKLEQIALNVDSLSTHVHLDFLIEKMMEKGDTEKVQKLEEMKSRVDEGTRAAELHKPTAAGEEADE